jgi:hypothetical protein
VGICPDPAFRDISPQEEGTVPSSSLSNPLRRWKTLTLVLGAAFVVVAAWSASAQATYNCNDGLVRVIASGGLDSNPSPADRVIDVPGSSTAGDVQLQMWDRHNGANQKWCVRQAWDLARRQYWYQLVNINSGKCMDQEANANGARVKQFWCTGNLNQRWVFYNINQLQNLDGHKCLDVSGVNPNRGARLIVWDCHWGWNQTWDFLP